MTNTEWAHWQETRVERAIENALLPKGAYNPAEVSIHLEYTSLAAYIFGKIQETN